MIRTGKRLISIMVLYAIALHLTWAVLVANDASAVNATAVNALFKYVHDPSMVAWILVGAAGCATVGLFTRVPWIVLLLIPQQIILMMSAAGAVEAIWLAQFADGVIRSRAFLAADQCYSIWAAIGHTIAIVAHARTVAGAEADRVGPR